MKPVCHVVAGPNGSGKSTFALERIAALIGGRATFGFETTLSGRGHLKLLADARKTGYRICLYYLWMPEKLMLPSRIRHRVLSGGHDVPSEDVFRRYGRSVANLRDYAKLADQLYVFDATRNPQEMIFGRNGRTHAKDVRRAAIMRKELGI